MRLNTHKKECTGPPLSYCDAKCVLIVNHDDVVYNLGIRTTAEADAMVDKDRACSEWMGYTCFERAQVKANSRLYARLIEFIVSISLDHDKQVLPWIYLGMADEASAESRRVQVDGVRVMTT